MIKNRQLHKTDCGNCKHWHPWSDEKQVEYWRNHHFLTKDWHPGDLRLGECDKNPCVVPSEYASKWAFSIFEDENYDEEFNCFEGRDGDA